MKTCVFPLTILLVLSLSACTSATAPLEELVLSQTYTMVAMTITPKSNSVASTATPASTATSVPASSPYPSIVATSTISAYSDSNLAASGCNESAYVSDVTIKDGTKLAPGQTFAKTWKIKNIGTCKWNKAYSMTFVSGNDMDGTDTEINRPVDPGETAAVTVSLTAPDAEGAYTGYWTLADKSGTAFGEKVYVEIVVSDDAVTSTATSTPTVGSNTEAPTSVPASATPLPTNALTSTPTSDSVVLPTDTPGD